jgi:uncharacterized membrane protein YfcA
MLNMASLALLSVAVGLLGSLTGLGGASILIPVMVLAGVPVKEAIACGMVAIIATSSGSAASFVRHHIANVRIAMFLEMFTIGGAIAGATITTIVSPVYLYFLFAGFLLSSFTRARKSIGEFIPVTTQDRISQKLRLEGSYFDEATGETVSYRVTNAIPGGLGMLVAGLAAGMLGIGAGAFKVTVQENILHMPPKVASTTSNFIIGMTALAGASVYFFSGLLNLTLMAPMAVGTTVGSIAGGRLLNRLRNRGLRIMFYVVVVYLVVQMIYKGVQAI